MDTVLIIIVLKTREETDTEGISKRLIGLKLEKRTLLMYEESLFFLQQECLNRLKRLLRVFIMRVYN